MILNGKRPVRNAKHEQILREGAKLGYTPNAAARSLKRRRFKRIACAFTRFGQIGSTSHSPYTGYVDAATDSLAERGYSLILEPFHLDERSKEFIEPPRLFAELDVDGVLGVDATGIVPACVDERLGRMGASVVWVNRNAEPGVRSIRSDESANAEMLVRHLVELGHARIAYFGPENRHYSTVDRCGGVRRSLAEAGLDISGVERTRDTLGRAEQLLDAHEPYSAVICYDPKAHHAMLELASVRGLRVPQDLSLCCFSSPWHALMFDTYPATTVAIAETEMSLLGVEALIAAGAGEEPPPLPAPVAGTFLPGMSSTPPGEPADRRRTLECRRQQVDRLASRPGPSDVRRPGSEAQQPGDDLGK